MHCDKRLVPLAAIPLIFSAHQFCEGWVWVGINQSEPRILKASALSFLFFALFFWPVWSSLSALAMEPRQHVRALLRLTAGLGAILGGCLYLPLLLDPDRLTIDALHHYDASARPQRRSQIDALEGSGQSKV